MVCPVARHFILYLVLVQPRKTGKLPNITKIVDGEVNHQLKQTLLMGTIVVDLIKVSYI